MPVESWPKKKKLAEAVLHPASRLCRILCSFDDGGYAGLQLAASEDNALPETLSKLLHGTIPLSHWGYLRLCPRIAVWLVISHHCHLMSNHCSIDFSLVTARSGSSVHSPFQPQPCCSLACSAELHLHNHPIATRQSLGFKKHFPGCSQSRPPFIGTHKAQPSAAQRRDPAQIRFQSAAPSSLAVALSRRDKLRVTSPQNSFPLTGPVSVRSPCHGNFACHATPCQQSPIEMCPLLHSMLV
ncbi:hypothetical protein CCHR01_18282 [Colletotrichum chrysophilum]|uniref:Uncharacterized protein n=1 Tax=Colletotrichum chrysophilum TaxID=1836956 RepID=A0AAD9E653_9PEZI|nr:hypothetical protein CCHR01_18282 [Colletotrichum chrysophilum]